MQPATEYDLQVPIFLAYTIAKLHRAVEVVEVLKAQLDECRQGAGK